MKVKDLMRHDVFVCMAHDRLADAAHLMWTHDIGCVPVVDVGHHPVAMITDRDICMAAYTSGLPLHLIPVARAMSKTLVKVMPETSLATLEHQMQEAQIRRVPVVDEDGILVGIITLADLAEDARSLRMPTHGPGVLKTISCVSERRWHGPLASLSERHH